MAFFSNTLHNIVTTQLKTDVLKLEKEKLYFEMLSKKLLVLDNNSNYKKFSLHRTLSNSEKHFKEENFLIVYIITITFLQANTSINVSDIKGNVKLSFTSGSVNLIGKQKRNRVKSVSRLIALLSKKATFLKNCPVSIHLHNVSSHKSLILSKLKNSFFIRLVKSFNQSPYNGCRKRKVRRKKHVKKFK